MEYAPITVIIPCYCCKQTIEKTLESVVHQTYRPKELFLIDDASPDGTIQILYQLQNKYGSDWIQVFQLPFNQGPSTARNYGWKRSSQPYIAFLDADDIWHPQKIEIQYKWMIEHPQYVITGHRYRYLRNNLPFFQIRSIPKKKNLSKTKMLFSNYLSTPSVMLKRELLERFDPKKRYAEDYLLWLTLLCRGYLAAYIDLPLVYLLKHAYGSGGLSKNLWKMEKGELEVYWQLHKDRYLSIFPLFILLGFSLIKYLRRVILSFFRT